ncbi:hypothetical protein FA13DRAFT_1077130 [Coprinellus micaceus]|uniref:Uncharacterized protein n=1 Tax=Coprinellus micaceus TaxID=71717 RepID=A0A4Y7TR59_COPMI|nr:hypothetical protein FA13DRAFT_1077130 [Coprinellus micaceus]
MDNSPQILCPYKRLCCQCLPYQSVRTCALDRLPVLLITASLLQPTEGARLPHTTATYSGHWHDGGSVEDPPSFRRYGPPTSVDGNTFTFFTISQTTENGGSAIVFSESHPPPRYTVANIP